MSFPDVFKALSDPVRREILTLLKQQGKMPAGEIAAEFELSNATISYHLSMLRKADLVFETRYQKYIYYEIVAFIAIAKDEATQHIKVFATALKLLPSDTNILYSYMITMLITMFNTTGVSISIEKNKIEVLKSFPISAMDIFVPKVALQLYLSIPVIIVLNSVMAVMLKFDFRTILLGYLMPITFSAFSSVLGYGINILLPNFDWENITFVVKRSLSTIICAIANVLIALGNLVLLSRVKILDSYSTGFSTTIVVSILSFTIFLLILFKGDEQFSHMEL